MFVLTAGNFGRSRCDIDSLVEPHFEPHSELAAGSQRGHGPWSTDLRSIAGNVDAEAKASFWATTHKETTYVGKAMAADNIFGSWPRIDYDGNSSRPGVPTLFCCGTCLRSLREAKMTADGRFAITRPGHQKRFL